MPERVINNFLNEIPLPPPGRVEVEWYVVLAWICMYQDCIHDRMASHLHLFRKLGDIALQFKRPPPNKKGMADFDISLLFQYVSLDAALSVLLC